ncbi:MAG: hypothetical protein JWO85_2467 [Candidatus Eremiobacteraeota bacterium]|nr:hypothetical protein [Candidatus Eremiobacteraeota bacterium]
MKADDNRRDPGNAARMDLSAEGGMTVLEAAEWLSLGKSMTYKLIADGRLAHVRVGAKIIVPRKAAQQFLADRLTR